jgi:hypothetical protein
MDMKDGGGIGLMLPSIWCKIGVEVILGLGVKPLKRLLA